MGSSSARSPYRNLYSLGDVNHRHTYRAQLLSAPIFVVVRLDREVSMLRARGVVNALLASGAVALSALLACSDQHSTGPNRAAIEPIGDVLRTTSAEDCPEEIPPEDCRLATMGERSDLWWSIEFHTNWAIPVCADIGNLMQDYAYSIQNLRIFPYSLSNPLTAGTWTPGTGGSTRGLSFADVLFGQGWSSERGKTALHEGHHAFYGGSAEDDAESFAEMCLDN
jgi:hypothetical protein